MSRRFETMDRTFDEAKRLCYAGLDEATLLKEVTERMRRAVPFHYCVHTHDPSSGLITRSESSEPEVKEQAPVFLGYVNFEDEVAPFEWMNQQRLAAVTLSEATAGRLDRALRYRELFVLLGFKHEVRSVFSLSGEMWGSIDAMRERASPDFTDREVQFFRRIGPHFAAGLKAAALQQEAALAGSDEDASVPGMLTLNREGQVLQYTQAAERWLQEIEEIAPGWQEANLLPGVISSIAGALRRTLGPGTDREKNSVPRLLVRGRSGRWLTLHGARTEPRPGRESETMVVIEPARPREVSWLRTSAYGLTDREREVVDLVTRGLSTKQISQVLYISEYTVQDHLSNVFDKVGVRGRRALVKHLYLESFPA